MAGHSHWAGIKHRKGRADKQRSKIFSKISKEITVAAKLGSKDSDTNPRLRQAIHIKTKPCVQARQDAFIQENLFTSTVNTLQKTNPHTTHIKPFKGSLGNVNPRF